MNNLDFNEVLARSYEMYLNSGARSNKKLKILHGAIAKDLQIKLGEDYEIKALGIGTGKEAKIAGRYMDKYVDIAVFKNGESLGGIAVKYVMSNYSQNSNNYFENMLGETANLRCGGKAYFQLVVLPKYVPYFKKDGTIAKIEQITDHNIDKYIKLSEDNIDVYMHTPTRTLFCLIETPEIDTRIITNKEQFVKEMQKNEPIKISLCNDIHKFEDSIIYNDYTTFIDKVINYINFLAN